MKTHDPLRNAVGYAAVVMLAALGMLGLGLLLYWWHNAADVGVLADQELMARLSHGEITCTGMNMDKYVTTSLGYHQELKKLFRSIANAFLLFGVILGLVGGLQLRALHKVSRQVPGGGQAGPK